MAHQSSSVIVSVSVIASRTVISGRLPTAYSLSLAIDNRYVMNGHSSTQLSRHDVIRQRRLMELCSIGDKAPRPCDCITSDDCDVFAVGYYRDMVRFTHWSLRHRVYIVWLSVQREERVHRLTSNHGGICLLHKSHVMAREVNQPV